MATTTKINESTFDGYAARGSTSKEQWIAQNVFSYTSNQVTAGDYPAYTTNFENAKILARYAVSQGKGIPLVQALRYYLGLPQNQRKLNPSDIIDAALLANFLDPLSVSKASLFALGRISRG